MPTPAGEPVVLHVWVAAGHTLCELETGDYIDEQLQELWTEGAAVCGPCLLIVGRLRRQACALLDLADDAVAPERPSEAWRLLGKSAWGSRLDIGTFLSSTPHLDERTQFDAVRYQVDPSSVAELVAEMQQALAAASDRRRD